jgi:predicted N-acetyltransferase YhbS
MLQYQPLGKEYQAQLADLFCSTFSASEGEQEGQLIGALTSELGSLIDHNKVFCFASLDKQTIAGAIFFTPLHYNTELQVSMLAPVAVSPDYQQQGVGKTLIQYGLEQLKAQGWDVAVTYGDPAYYGKFGFQPLSEKTLKAPLPLSMPEGWQAMSLKGEAIPVLAERPTCVKPFNDPQLW